MRKIQAIADSQLKKAVVQPPKLQANQVEGISLLLQSASGPDHKQGLNDTVLGSYREGIIKSGFSQMPVLLFLVTEDHYDRFEMTESDGNLWAFKFCCPIKRTLRVYSSQSVADVQSSGIIEAVDFAAICMNCVAVVFRDR